MHLCDVTVAEDPDEDDDEDQTEEEMDSDDEFLFGASRSVLNNLSTSEVQSGNAQNGTSHYSSSSSSSSSQAQVARPAKKRKKTTMYTLAEGLGLDNVLTHDVKRSLDPTPIGERLLQAEQAKILKKQQAREAARQARSSHGHGRSANGQRGSGTSDRIAWGGSGQRGGRGRGRGRGRDSHNRLV